MLRVYNYMILGLAITGIAALGIYMLSVTDDLTAAAKVVRGGAEIPARLAGNVYLTPLGYAVFVSPLKWVVILAPLALVFGLSFGIERLRPAVAASNSSTSPGGSSAPPASKPASSPSTFPT